MVLTSGGLPTSDYIDKIARTISGNYLDHNVRVNSAVSSYRIVNTMFSQRVGDFAGPLFLTQKSLNFSVIPASSTIPELVDVPFVVLPLLMVRRLPMADLSTSSLSSPHLQGDITMFFFPAGLITALQTSRQKESTCALVAATLARVHPIVLVQRL